MSSRGQYDVIEPEIDLTFDLRDDRLDIAVVLSLDQSADRYAGNEPFRVYIRSIYPRRVAASKSRTVDTSSDLFRQADAISIHVPLTNEIREAVSSEEIKEFGLSGVLINTSRGPVFVESVLLEEGIIAEAGLDDFQDEPPSNSNLLSRNDVVVTPHIGGVTEFSLHRMSQQAAANIRMVYNGEPPESTVNPDSMG